MALAGKSSDGVLLGRPYETVLYGHVAFVALTSTTNTDLWYWGKAIDGVHTLATSVQFSTDGKLLIAHSGSWSTGYTLVFDTASGNILSARTLVTSSNLFSDIQFGTKSMVISSGTSSMAYVLSNYRPNWNDWGNNW
jgi:hypothetical protein